MNRKYFFPALILAATALGAFACWFRLPVVPFGICVYLVLTLVPGLAAYQLAAKTPDFLHGLTFAVTLSPVLMTMVGVAVMLVGVSARTTGFFLIVVSCAFGLLAFRRRSSVPWISSVSRRQAIALFALLLIVSVAISCLPFTRDWWRMKSDAMFHRAVVAQIVDFGIPPEDPFTIGLPLQYMWFFHVFLVILSEASGIGPFMVMALANVHAIIGFALAAFLLSSVLRKAFAQNYAAMLTVVFGMNAAFWFFLPLKLLRAGFGEVRGGDEIARVLSLRPFDFHAVRGFVQVGFNQEFLLDKFMVGTAFSLGLCMMAVLWWAAASYVTHEKKEHLLAAFLTAFGVVAFHTALGSVAFAGVAGGVLVLIVLRRSLKGYDIRPVLILFVALVLCGILLLPYLYSVSHAKTEGRALPLGLSASKMLGILVSCALVIFLSSFQAKRILRARDVGTYFMVCTTVTMLGICTIVQLPAANSYDKFPFLIFFPLAVVGGWTIAEFSERAPTPRTRIRRYVLASLVAFGPLNIFMFAGYYNSTPIVFMNDNEKKVAEWIRAATPRESVIIDSRKWAFLTVFGPRRYYLASESYGEAWGYDRKEISKRSNVKNDIYSPGSLEPLTLETMGRIPYPVFVILRRDDTTLDARKFAEYPELFRLVFTSGPISVFEVNRPACLSTAGAGGPGSE